MGQALRNVKMTIGGPESSAGTATAREYVVPITDMPGLRGMPTKEDDPVIVGRNMRIGRVLTARDVMGDTSISVRPCGGLGQLLNSLLGQEGTPAQIAACIRIRYSGSEASAKLSADTSADTLDSDVGDLGSESGDTNFGTSGSIDLTSASTDTVGELVTEIDGYADYECEKVFGADATDAADIIDITSAQGKDRWVYVWFSSVTSGVYLHQWPAVLGNTERPVYSVQIDNIHDNFLFDGVVVDRMSISAALKALVTGSFSALGMGEATGQTANTALELPDYADALRFSDGSFAFDGTDFAYIRDLSLDITNNSNTEGYGMGSLARQYQEKGTLGASGSARIRYSSDAYALRASGFAESQVGLDVMFKRAGKLGTNLPSLMVVEAPYVEIDDYETPLNGDQLDANVSFTVVYPRNNAYGSPLQVSLLTKDSGAY